MKKSLLSICVMTFTAVSAFAQSWVAPSLQYTNTSVLEKAAIYNVAQQRFLTKGGAWGNHASLGSAADAFVYDIEAQQEEGVYKLHCSSAKNTGYLGRESIKDVYTDFNNQAAWGTLWSFEKVETTGNYRIMSAASCPNFGYNKYLDEDGYFDEGSDMGSLWVLGWSPNEQDLTNGTGEPMGSNVGCYMFDMTLEENAEVSVEWAFVTEEAFAVYNAQSTLYDKLVEAYNVGYSEAELSNYAALLGSTDVNAIAEAKTAVDQLILNYGYNHATPDNPYDVSAVILNSTFDGAKGAKPADWIATDNALIQNNKVYADYEGTNPNAFNNFVQDWTSSNNTSINAADIHQVIADLPQGTYRLTAYCIATSGSADLVPTGAELYAESGVIHYSTPVSMPYGSEGSGAPHLIEVDITHFGGDLTIGYGFTPGYVKWWGVDNMKLYYCGPVANPGLLALTSTYASAQTYIENYEGEEVFFTAASYEALKSELSAADAIMAGADSEACQEEAAKLNEMLPGIKAEIAAYEKLNNLVAKVAVDVESYTVSVPSLGETLADMRDTYESAYYGHEATIEQIEAWIAGYNDVVVSGIKDAMSSASVDNPIEITALFPNMGFEENTAETNKPNGWTCEAGAFKARANTAEVWQAAFNCYRVLEGLPAGAYKLTAKALSRVGSSADNYATYDPEENQQLSRLYINAKMVPVADQASGATPEQRYTNDANVGTEDEPMWVPNSMEGARVYFNVDELYNNEVIGVSLNDNDPITIGIKHEGDVPGNSWTIWSNFRLYYLGVSSNALYETMVALAENAQESAETAMTEDGLKKLEDAIDASDKLDVTSSSEAITEAIGILNEALEYNAATPALFEKLMTMVSDIEEKSQNMDIESDYAGLDDMLAEAGDAIADEMAKSNEQMEAWLTNLPKELVKYVQFPVLKSASEENPGDITAAITNPSFDTGTNDTNGAYGWTFDWTNGGGGHIGWNNTTQQEGSHYAYEFWDLTAFDMHQTIAGLAEGYYRLSCNNLYRNGNNTEEVAQAYEADPAASRMLYLYANEAEKAGNSVYDYAQTEDPAWDGQGTATLAGATVYLPNTMISAGAAFEQELYTSSLEFHLNDGADLKFGLRLNGEGARYSWCLFDNFKLEYLGTTTPNAIEGIATESVKSAIYDLQGRKVSRVQKGLYIKSGKVVVVK